MSTIKPIEVNQFVKENHINITVTFSGTKNNLNELVYLLGQKTINEDIEYYGHPHMGEIMVRLYHSINKQVNES